MSELVTTRITAHAARLGLHHLAASAPALIQRAHDAQLGYADFPGLILGEETAAKDDRRFTSALHVSGLPHHKTLDDHVDGSPHRARPEPGRTRLRPAPAPVRKRQADQRPAVRLLVGAPRGTSPMGQDTAGQHALDTPHHPDVG